MQSYTTAQNWATLIGRILFSFVYIDSCIIKIVSFDSTLASMRIEGIHHYVYVLLLLAIIVELVGSLAILFGFFIRLGAVLIFFFSLATAVGIHHYWTYPPLEMYNQLFHFLKNIALMGGALYIMSFGAGQYSFDAIRLAKSRNKTSI
jgi:putative oxidoreductase